MRVDLQVHFTPGTRFTCLRFGAEHLPWTRFRFDEIVSNWSLKPSVRSAAPRSTRARLKDRPAWNRHESVPCSDLTRPCPWRMHSRLEPIRQVGKTLESRWEVLPNAFDSKLADTCVEAANSLIQTAQAQARGHGASKHLITVAHDSAGKLTHQPASPLKLHFGATGSA